MYSISVSRTGATDIVGHLSRTVESLRSLRPIGEKARELLEDENIAARLEGVGAAGNRLADLSPETLRREDRGPGPAMVPRGAESRAISAYRVVVNEPTPGRVIVLGRWPGIPWIKYHTGGKYHSGRLPVRNFVGVRPGTDAQVVAMIHAEISAIVRGEGI